MKDPNWLKRELAAAVEAASKMPDWKRWGAEIETRDTAPLRVKKAREPSDEGTD